MLRSESYLQKTVTGSNSKVRYGLLDTYGFLRKLHVRSTRRGLKSHNRKTPIAEGKSMTEIDWITSCRFYHTNAKQRTKKYEL